MYEHYSTGWYINLNQAMERFVEYANNTKCAIVCCNVIHESDIYRVSGILIKLYNKTS